MKTLKDIRPGQTVGRYEFLVPIAQGGMAAVWAARQRGSRGFSKTVAVKTMLPTISDDPRFEQMFLDEARIASRIRHPNVVEILDLGEQDDVLYLVMEWVDGEPLSQVRYTAVEDGPFPLPIAVKILMDACAGLHAAHELTDEDGNAVGLVHRDISPQNILVGYDGAVKLVDFGVAKTAGRSAETTNAGQVKGKPPYMSPEQALGKSVDRRTDLFALGIVLYQLATGRHPMRGETDVATLHNIVSNQPILPPGVYNAQFPLQLERVIMKSLARDPEQRFQTARDFELALEEVTQDSLPRVRTEEVGRFVNELLGSHGEERRAAVRESIRLADERALAGRHRTTGDAPAAIGARDSLVDLEDEMRTPGVTPRRDSAASLLANELTVVDESLRARRASHLTLWIGVALGMVLGGIVYWAVARRAVAQKPTHGSSAPTTIVQVPTAADALAATAPAATVNEGGPPTASVIASQTPVARHPPAKPSAVPKGVSGFAPPPVSNPGF